MGRAHDLHTRVLPDAVFTVRTYTAAKPPATQDYCAIPPAATGNPPGQRRAESLKAETWPKSGEEEHLTKQPGVGYRVEWSR